MAACYCLCSHVCAISTVLEADVYNVHAYLYNFAKCIFETRF